jgi:hypothetical protein
MHNLMQNNMTYEQFNEIDWQSLRDQNLASIRKYLSDPGSIPAVPSKPVRVGFSYGGQSAASEAKSDAEPG